MPLTLVRVATAALFLATWSAHAAPTAQELEKLVLESKRVFTFGCLGVLPLFDRADAFDANDPNLFRAYATYQAGSDSLRRLEFDWLRALAKAGVLREETAAGSYTFRLADLGWAQVRPGNGLCVDFGRYDRLAIRNIKLQPGGREVSFQYQIDFSPASLAPWTRGTVQSEIPLLRTLIQAGDTVPAEATVEGPTQWKLVYADPPRRVPMPSAAEVLSVASDSLAELRAQEACFPLPASRPQLGVAVTQHPGYTLTILPMDRLNSTQRSFRADLAEQLEDWVRAGLLEKTGPSAYRLSATLNPLLRTGCLAVGTFAPQVVRHDLDEFYQHDAFFKIRAAVQPSPLLLKDKPGLASQRDFARFVARGLACEGRMRWAAGWNVTSKACYPAY